MKNRNILVRGATLVVSCILGISTLAGVADAAEPYPDHLINGDFEYPNIPEMNSPDNWTSIDPVNGQWLHHGVWEPFGGFDRARFAWDSTQQDGGGNDGDISNEQRAHAVELQKDRNGNQYAELCADQAGTAIFQNISTVPGAVYRIRLDHASLNASHLDSMQVLVGPDMGHLTAVPMTRLTSNGSDPTGPVGTTIATTASNTGDRDHSGQWETYQGTYTIPAGQTTTVFTFKSLGSRAGNYGNLLDNISFQVAYPLDYDLNGGTGSVPSR
jgi:hypothetical protein